MARDFIDSFIDTYVQALRDQNAAVFAGVGLSMPAGMVNWKELLKDIAGDIGLSVDKEDDLVIHPGSVLKRLLLLPNRFVIFSYNRQYAGSPEINDARRRSLGGGLYSDGVRRR